MSTQSQKKLHEAIGSIVHNHARIENALATWVTRLIGDEVIGIIVTSEMPYKSLIKALNSLLIHHSANYAEIKEQKAKTTSLIKRINKVEQDRNKYAHSMILIYEETEKYQRIKFSAKEKQGLILHRDEMNLADLIKIKNEQESILKEISKLSILTNPNSIQSIRKINQMRKEALGKLNKK
jgi:hypothetical protein